MPAADSSRRWPVLLGGLAAAGAAAWLVLWLGGGADIQPVTGIPARDQTVVWLVGLIRVVTDGLAVATIGLLTAAAFLVPGGDSSGGRIVSAHGYRWLRAAGVTATLWSLTTLAAIPITLADVLAVDLAGGAGLPAIVNFTTTVDQGRALLLIAAMTAVLAVAARSVITVTGAAILTGLAAAALLPTLFTSHAASAGDHQQAVNNQLFHVYGAAFWAGGLLALLLARTLPTPQLARAASRYSRLAAICLTAVAATGLFNTAVRFNTPTEIFGDNYGRVMLVKTAFIVVLAWLGWLHRRRTLPMLRSGDRRPFRRLAAVEVIVFATVVGLSATLTRTPPPPGDQPSESFVESALGFAMPDPLTLRTALLDWYPDPLGITAAAVAVVLYAAGGRRLRRRGEPWPTSRLVAWLAGWALVVVATSSSLARYGPVLFSGHVTVHLILAAIAPIALVLAAPVQLARTALELSTDDGLRGPREWLDIATASGPARALTNPAVVVVLYLAALYAMYLPPLYEASLRSHATHLAAVALYLTAGCAFFGRILRRGARPALWSRVALLGIALAGHLAFGLLLLQGQPAITPEWFGDLGRDWGPDLPTDLRTGGVLTLAMGTTSIALATAALTVRRWRRHRSAPGQRPTGGDRAPGLRVKSVSGPDNPRPAARTRASSPVTQSTAEDSTTSTMLDSRLLAWTLPSYPVRADPSGTSGPSPSAPTRWPSSPGSSPPAGSPRCGCARAARPSGPCSTSPPGPFPSALPAAASTTSSPAPTRTLAPTATRGRSSRSGKAALASPVRSCSAASASGSPAAN